MTETVLEKASNFQESSALMLNTLIKRHPKIKEAQEFAKKTHKGQKRKSREPYFNHCRQVAEIITDWIQDKTRIKDINLVCAAFLHDVTEESNTSLMTLRKKFGDDVAELVDGVSKFKSQNSREEDSKTRRKIVIKGYLDPRVFVLKLADRLHNMRTLEFLPRKTRIRKSLETQDVYSPLAESLGMWEVKMELEDLAFKSLNPKEYNFIKKIRSNDQRVKYFSKKLATQIKKLCKDNNIKSKVYIKLNGFWQIKKKINENLLSSNPFESIKKIDDLVSIRVLVDNIRQSYFLLGLIEERFAEKIDFEAFDNYLIKPAINGYSALHTSIKTAFGSLEIAITTFEKENYNLYGFLNKLKKGQTNNHQTNYLKLIFDKQDKVYFMPKKARGVDFAYVFPEIASSAKEILINKKPYPLNKVLPNGSTVEIIYSKVAKRSPKNDLIKYALDKNKKLIARQIELSKKDKIINDGKKKLTRLLRPRGILALEDAKKYAWRLVCMTSSENVDQLILKYSTGAINKSKMNKLLNQVGLTKTKANLSTIKVSGKNQPGILAKLTRLIAKEGGDIRNISQDISAHKFMLRILVKGLKPPSLAKIERNIKKDLRFKKVLVV